MPSPGKSPHRNVAYWSQGQDSHIPIIPFQRAYATISGLSTRRKRVCGYDATRWAVKALLTSP